jgi:hypothetical protein
MRHIFFLFCLIFRKPHLFHGISRVSTNNTCALDKNDYTSRSFFIDAFVPLAIK